MIKMDKTPYGLHIVMEGLLNLIEMTQWQNDLGSLGEPKMFNLLVLLDLSNAQPLRATVKQAFQNGIDTLAELNLVRISIIYRSFSMYLQIKNQLIKVGVDQYRFFQTKMPAFGRVSREWLINGKLD